MITVRVGTVFSWQTRSGRHRYAKVISITDNLLFLRDADGKPIEFRPSGLLQLIEDGVIAMVRRRTKTGKWWRLLKITIEPCNFKTLRRSRRAGGTRIRRCGGTIG